jgi:hypothetical protein
MQGSLQHIFIIVRPVRGYGLAVPSSTSSFLTCTNTAPAVVCWTAADTVTHTMVLQNTGNAKLRGLGISTVLASQVSNSVPGLTAYSCKLDNTGSALALPQPLAAGHSLHCTATYTFSDASIIEAGNLTFTPTVSATDTSAGDIQQADALMVTVPSLPVIDVHLADATCPTTPALSAPTIGMLAVLADAAAL